MEIETKERSGALIARLVGEFDVGAADRFRTEIDTLLDADKRLSCLILDLSEVTFIDSSGIGAILGRYRKMTARGGVIRAVGLKPTVRRVFEFSGMTGLIPAYADVKQALAGR